MATEKQLTEEESLRLIHEMISKAKGSYYDTGTGPILWGNIIKLCSLGTFAGIQFEFGFPFNNWLITLIAIIPQVIISIKEGTQRKVVRYEDVAMSYIWMAFGVSIFLLIHINSHVFASLNPIIDEYKKLKAIDSIDFGYSSYTTSMFLLLYGMPSILTGGIMKFRPMLYGGILCWICCIVSVYTDSKVYLL